MKKIKMFFCVVIMFSVTFGLNCNSVSANEKKTEIKDTQVVHFINSQDTQKFELEDFVSSSNSAARVLVKNDGGYKSDTAGTYHVTYMLENTSIEKTFPITVVQSKERIVETKLVGYNTIVLDDELFTTKIGQLDNIFETRVNETAKLSCLVENIDGSYSYIETGTAAVTNWQREPITNDDRYTYTLRISELATQPSMAKEAKNATYSNDWDSVSECKNAIRVYGVGQSTVQEAKLISFDDRIMIKGKMPILNELKAEVLYGGGMTMRRKLHILFLLK